MSTNTDMLAAAQVAYNDALSGKSKQLNGRRLDHHVIAALRQEMLYWQGQVDAETARAAGESSRKPLQVVL